MSERISNKRIKEMLADNAHSSAVEFESSLKELLYLRTIVRFKVFTKSQPPIENMTIEVINKETGFISRAVYRNCLDWNGYKWRYPIKEINL